MSREIALDKPNIELKRPVRKIWLLIIEVAIVLIITVFAIRYKFQSDNHGLRKITNHRFDGYNYSQGTQF